MLKLGLAFKKLMKPDSPGPESNSVGMVSRSFSFRELESESGIRHATIVEIVNGKKNPAWSTIDALLEGLAISLTEFASVYDSLTKKEVLEYKQEIQRKKRATNKSK